MINKRVSFHFLFHKPISKVWASEGSALFIKLKGEKNSKKDAELEEVTISLSECYWKVYQGDNLVIDNNSHPEVIEDFCPGINRSKNR